MKFFTSTLLFLSIGLYVLAQESGPEPREYYQIFLQNPVQKVKRVSYSDGTGNIQFRLSEDHLSIYLLDYDGKKKVTAEVVNESGKKEDITKTHCFINNLPEL